MYLGIDLGTSNSSIAGMQNSVPRVFKTPDGADYLPSAIYIDRRGNRLYGERAYAQTFMSPDNVATGFKRLMGTKTNFEFSASGQVLTAEPQRQLQASPNSTQTSVLLHSAAQPSQLRLMPRARLAWSASLYFKNPSRLRWLL